jgi:NAD(P)-dependent dehydrogenase (short-subunit alcohol dehydrogenase family)
LKKTIRSNLKRKSMSVLDMFRLDGSVAIVTGGAQGLGLQMATALAEAGAQVVVASRNLQRCQEAAEALPVQDGPHMALPLDLNDSEAAAEMVRAVLARYGRIDILVNAAAATDVNRTFEELTAERWETILRVNLTGALRCAQAVFDPMRARARGKIINIVSVYGLLGVDARLYGATVEKPMCNFPYTASKGGLVNLTREMAMSWAIYGINVNALSPGIFPDETTAGRYPAGTLDRLQQRIPLGRFGGKTDLKGATVFLASAASDYMTGHILVVDGGWTAW